MRVPDERDAVERQAVTAMRGGIATGRLDDLLGLVQEASRSACAVWPYSSIPDGYGNLTFLNVQLLCHRLALRYGKGNPPKGRPLALHGPCHNRLCVNPGHLRWGDKADNARDRSRDGTAAAPRHGNNHPWSRLTRDEVVRLKAAYRNGEGSYADLAERYGTSKSNVALIMKGRNWREVS